MKRSSSCKNGTLCCGAGGGCFWKEECEGSRINHMRFDQLNEAKLDGRKDARARHLGADRGFDRRSREQVSAAMLEGGKVSGCSNLPGRMSLRAGAI
jgi:hypothetical protein